MGAFCLVGTGVLVGCGVLVAVGVLVGRGVLVTVGVNVCVTVGVKVLVGVAVKVAVAVAVGVRDGFTSSAAGLEAEPPYAKTGEMKGQPAQASKTSNRMPVKALTRIKAGRARRGFFETAFNDAGAG